MHPDTTAYSIKTLTEKLTDLVGSYDEARGFLLKCFGPETEWIIGSPENLLRHPPAEATEPSLIEAASGPMAVQVGGNHYKGDKIQHFTLCMEDNLPWGESSAIKYLMRHRKKNGLQDLLKALHYVEMTIEYYHPGALAEHRRDQS